jgi:hypothetical protein
MFPFWISQLFGSRVPGLLAARRRRLPLRLEALEDRTLLATSHLLAGVLTVTGADVNGQIVLSSGGATDRVLVDGAAFSGVSSIVVNGGAADDTLVVDDSQGPVAPTIDYHGGGGFNTLVLQGGTATADVYSPGPTRDAGVCTLAFGGVTQTVRFTGLAPVVDTTAAPNLTVNGTSGNDTITYSQGSTAATGLVAVNDLETIEFSNKATLTLNGLAGMDGFLLTNPNTPTGLTRITVDGGADSDSLTVNGISAVANVVYTPPVFQTGHLDYLDAAANPLLTVDLLNLESVFDLEPAAKLTVNDTATDFPDRYAPGLGTNAGRVEIGGAASIEFANKTTLALNIGRELTLDNANTPTGLTGITVNGNDTATLIYSGSSAADTFSVDAAGTIQLSGHVPVRTTAVNHLSVFGLGGSNSFSFAGNHPFPGGIEVNTGGTGDPLTVNATANQFVVVQQVNEASGDIRTYDGTGSPALISYHGSVTVTPNVAIGTDGLPNLLVLGPDASELNDTPATATRLATFPAQAVHTDITDSPPDQDFYRIVPQTTGTVDIQVAFRLLPLVQGMGVLNAEVQDAAGNLIATVPGTLSKAGAAGGLRFRLPVVAGQTYYLRVFGPTSSSFNNYDLSVSTAGLPVPSSVALSPPAATARVNDPTLFVTVDDSGLLQDTGGNPALGPIAIPFNASTVPSGTDVTAAAPPAGFRVAVFDSPGTHHTLDPNDPTFIGFAQPVAGMPHLYALPVGSQGADVLTEGPHSITARVQVLDPTGQHSFGSLSTALSLTVAAVTPSECYVAQLYRDLLGREVDPYGSTVWAGALDAGILTRDGVARGITASPEYQNRALDQLYSRLLRRAVDAGGRSAWDTFLAPGGNLGQVEAGILASPEYFQSRGGNSNSTWLEAVSQDELGRALDDQGRAAWGNALNAGASLLAVAGGILGSPEADLQTVTRFYRQFLRREPDGAGLTAFAGGLQAGLANEMVLAALVGSPEYFQHFCQT